MLTKICTLKSVQPRFVNCSKNDILYQTFSIVNDNKKGSNPLGTTCRFDWRREGRRGTRGKRGRSVVKVWEGVQTWSERKGESRCMCTCICIPMLPYVSIRTYIFFSSSSGRRQVYVKIGIMHIWGSRGVRQPRQPSCWVSSAPVRPSLQTWKGFLTRPRQPARIRIVKLGLGLYPSRATMPVQTKHYERPYSVSFVSEGVFIFKIHI